MVLTGCAASALAACGIAIALAATDPGDERRRGAEPTPAELAERFLRRYQQPDGRVIRRDQGGDTVSEGQAYAMLLAVATGDSRRFATAWRWTRKHLARTDGLLAWHWADGRVVDREPATDADLDAAHALLLAARRFRVPRYATDARRIARSVLDRETARIGGRLVLLAGPWARWGGVVNPSYFALSGMAALGQASGDARWRELAASSEAITARLVARRVPLPPDWATVDGGGTPRATGPPRSAGAPAVYGFEAVRLPVRFAASCRAGARKIAARPWPFLRDTAARQGGLSAAYYRDGRPAAPYSHPAALVGAAGAAAAAGDRSASNRLLRHAAAMDDRSPTYYGAAWVALGRVLLQTRLLGGCGAR
jgi:endoglucanase